MKDSKLEISAEDIALAKTIKKLREIAQQEVPPTGSFEELLEHLVKVKEALEDSQEGSQLSREEREAKCDDAYAEMIQTATKGREAGNMRGWLSIPIIENDDGTLTSRVSVVLTSANARNFLLDSLAEVVGEIQKA